jgi:hypothetical protein
VSYILSGAGLMTQRYKKEGTEAKPGCMRSGKTPRPPESAVTAPKPDCGPFYKKIRRFGEFFILLHIIRTFDR